MNVHAMSIDSIHPCPGDPRLNDDGVDTVAEIVRRFGFRQPIVVDSPLPRPPRCTAELRKAADLPPPRLRPRPIRDR